MVDEQQHDSGERRISSGVALDEQDVDGTKGTVNDHHHVDKVKRNVLHVKDNAANGGVLDEQQDVSTLAGLIEEQQNNRIQCSVIEDQSNNIVEGVIDKGVVECVISHKKHAKVTRKL